MSKNAVSFDTFQPVREQPFVQSILTVRDEFGISPFRQVRDVFRYSIRKKVIKPPEYYQLKMYRVPDVEREQFLGLRGIADLNLKINNQHLNTQNGTVNNKVLHGLLLKQCGVAVPELEALVHDHQALGRIPSLRMADEIEAFLRNEARYPLFGKPLMGSLSVGCASLNGIDRDAGTLEMLDGSSIAVSAFAKDIVEHFRVGGYIFQGRVKQHPDIAHFCGGTVGTVRMVTLRDTEATEPLYAVWKLARPNAVADNFWRSGNLLAAIDIDTGEVLRVQQGVGPTSVEVTTHPDTGDDLIGFRIPLWDKVKAQVVEAARITSQIRMLGWDVAIGEEGAVIIEANTSPHHTLFEMAHQRGILNPDFKPRFDRVIAENEKLIEEGKAAAKSRGKANKARQRAATFKSADFSSGIRAKKKSG